MLTDRDGNVQVTVNKGKASKETHAKVEASSPTAASRVRGTVKAMAKAPNGAEVVPEDSRCSASRRRRRRSACTGARRHARQEARHPGSGSEEGEGPGDLQGPARDPFLVPGSSYRERDTSRSGPRSSSRPPRKAAHPSSPCSTTTALRSLRRAPSSTRRSSSCPFEKVYEIGPAFRAEESRTQRHLSEITSIDIEEAFVDYNDVMDTLEALLRHVVESVKDACAKDLESLGAPICSPPREVRAPALRRRRQAPSRCGRGPELGGRPHRARDREAREGAPLVLLRHRLADPDQAVLHQAEGRRAEAQRVVRPHARTARAGLRRVRG